MTIPLRAWSPISGGHPQGTNLDWTDAQSDTDVFMQEFADLLQPFFDDDCVFSDYTIYTYSDVNAPARPVASASLAGFVGTADATIPATQANWMFKTSEFGTFKLSLLDTKVSAAFGPLLTMTSPTYDDEIALRDFILDDTSIFQGRDNKQVVSWKKISYSLNDKLRQEYKLD
jgi:hypothetical protein